MKRNGISLARQYALLLAVFFVVFELLMGVVVVSMLMLPMARRAAGDLAGLMVLSAQTWAELPPHTRPAFEVELARNHLLALRADMPPAVQDPLHGPYLYFLEEALAEKAGSRLHLTAEVVGDQTWYWVSLPSGGGTISVGLPHDRIGTQPLNTMLISLAGGLVMALLAAVWLARLAVGPLARLERAAARVGRGEVPELLPEAGPRELATLAQRFNAMARQVRDLLAARTTLLAGVSHDLRTPLARMRVALALLEKKPGPKLFLRLEADIEEMDRLIGNVLDLARGLASGTLEDVDVRGLLLELAGSDGRVAVSSPELRVKAPPLGLRRAIGNLLDNARRYGGEAPIELVAEAWEGEIRIGVLDRGPGIPEEQLDAVFEPFHRLDAARNPAIGGAGLGLAIVRQLAQANHWRVELRRRDGGGLEAWLHLPPANASQSGEIR
ncbi:MAG: HAMP domain-containing protein [Gammaproteobacteria bacterium]|nr:HAMP domain-containing protein [Gammaproteobacteria bacterium]MBU1414719.1 HAMP domain-containing protein [Gammaproteobacteria bacterium]